MHPRGRLRQDRHECTFRGPPPAGWEEARPVASALVEATTATDGYGIHHAFTVANLSRLVGMELGLGEGALEALALGTLLHDLGKLGVTQSILHKVGPLARWEAKIIEETRRPRSEGGASGSYLGASCGVLDAGVP